jgi:hypothetical protein
MCNLLHVDHARCAVLPREEVLRRSATLLQPVERSVEQRRAQLCELSGFMRHLNQPLARRANLEDQCTGRFWDSGFKLRALPDATRLMAAMTHVDLSLLRLRPSPSETCGITSIQSRIEQAYSPPGTRCTLPLLAFDTPRSQAPSGCIPCTFRDYLELLEWTGRKLRADQFGAGTARTPYLLQRLELDAEIWLLAMQTTLDTAHTATLPPRACSSRRTIRSKSSRHHSTR